MSFQSFGSFRGTSAGTGRAAAAAASSPKVALRPLAAWDTTPLSTDRLLGRDAPLLRGRGDAAWRGPWRRPCGAASRSCRSRCCPPCPARGPRRGCCSAWGRRGPPPPAPAPSRRRARRPGRWRGRCGLPCPISRCLATMVTELSDPMRRNALGAKPVGRAARRAGSGTRPRGRRRPRRPPSRRCGGRRPGLRTIGEATHQDLPRSLAASWMAARIRT